MGRTQSILLINNLDLNRMRYMFLIALAGLCLASCKKNVEPKVESTDLYNNFFKVRQLQSQTFKLSKGSAGGGIKGRDGTQILFGENSFSDADNNAVTGPVTVSLTEALHKDEWVLNGLSTNSYEHLLLSAGMIKIAAYDAKGNTLSRNPASHITVKLPKFYSTIASASFCLWQLGADINNPAIQTWTPYDYSVQEALNDYSFQLPEFTWINCDALIDDARPKTTIKITPVLPRSSETVNLQAILVYRNINTVIALQPYNGLFKSYDNSIPIGSKADVVLIGRTARDEILFNVLRDVEFSANMNINIEAEIARAASVDAYLSEVRTD